MSQLQELESISFTVGVVSADSKTGDACNMVGLTNRVTQVHFRQQNEPGLVVFHIGHGSRKLLQN